MKTPSSLALVLLAASVGASAQSDKGAAPVKAPASAPAAAKPATPAVPAPVAAKPTPTPTPVPGPDGGSLIQSILEQETEIPKGGYIYNAAGRRDPFISLARPAVSDESASRPRRPGIEGFLLQETTLKGVVKNIDGWIAVLQGPDNKGYFVRVGQRMHDGVIILVDAAGLTFRQEITDPLSPAKSRDVRRLLNSAQEESNK